MGAGESGVLSRAGTSKTLRVFLLQEGEEKESDREGWGLGAETKERGEIGERNREGKKRDKGRVGGCFRIRVT